MMMEDIAAEFGGKYYVCCDFDQVNTMHEQLKALGSILQRCPACLFSLQDTFCRFTCHPRQAEMVVATETISKNMTALAVYKLDYYVNDVQITNIYDSCLKVYNPQSGAVALNFLCGSAGSRHCTPHKLFDYFGDSPMTPFPIAYRYTNETTVHAKDVNGTDVTVHPYDHKPVPCQGNKKHPEYGCLCADCVSKCPAVYIDDLPDTTPTMAGQMELVALVALLVFLLELVLVPLAYWMLRRKTALQERRKSSVVEIGGKQKPQLDQLQIWVQAHPGLISEVTIRLPASLELNNVVLLQCMHRFQLDNLYICRIELVKYGIFFLNVAIF